MNGNTLIGAGRSPWRRRPPLFLGSPALVGGRGLPGGAVAAPRALHWSGHHDDDRRRCRPTSSSSEWTRRSSRAPEPAGRTDVRPPGPGAPPLPETPVDRVDGSDRACGLLSFRGIIPKVTGVHEGGSPPWSFPLLKCATWERSSGQRMPTPKLS